MCDETDVVNAQSVFGGSDADPVAAGPFCNVATGIPTDYLDDDPEQVAQRMIGYGAIDADTGEAIPDNEYLEALGVGSTSPISYASWLDQCTDPTSNEELGACMINGNQKLADYALYTIDQRAMATMDGDGTDIANNPDQAYIDTPVATNYSDALAMAGEFLTGDEETDTTLDTQLAVTQNQNFNISLSDIIKVMPRPSFNSLDNLSALHLETPLWV